MKNLTRKLMLSIVAIALVVIALGTSTFAWFTLSNKASVGQFNAEVTAGEGMELSLDGTTWYSNIPSTVIQAKIASNFKTAHGVLNGADEPEPILTAVTTNHLNLEEFKKINADQTGWATAIENVDFIKIKIYVRAVGIDKVFIDTLEVTGTPADWTPDTTFDDAKGNEVEPSDTVNVSAANGARIGIRSANEEDATFVYENAESATNTVLGAPVTLPTNGQADYFLKKTSVNPNLIDGAPKKVIGSVQSVDPVDPVDPADPGVEVLTLTGQTSGYYTGNFDLFVWFEGFDPDTYDSILTMPLSIKMSFEGTPIPKED